MNQAKPGLKSSQILRQCALHVAEGKLNQQGWFYSRNGTDPDLDMRAHDVPLGYLDNGKACSIGLIAAVSGRSASEVLLDSVALVALSHVVLGTEYEPSTDELAYEPLASWSDKSSPDQVKEAFLQAAEYAEGHGD